MMHETYERIKMPLWMKDKWLAALRSGKYKQAQLVLKQETPKTPQFGGYCCLGLLQYVVDGDVERTPGGTSQAYPSRAWCKSKGIKGVAADGGWQVFVPSISCDRQTTLAILNDNRLFTFNEIADVIDREIEGY